MTPEHDHQAAASTGGMATAGDWDARYAASDQIWSGQPNGGLVTEIDDEVPGRALDVGCGEGADAVWLARKGWRVTAIDVSRVALDRAATAAETADVDVHWVHAGLLEAQLAEASFDLVSAQYAAIPRTEGNEAVTALFAAVAPGGTLLYVQHADIDPEHAKANGFDPDDFVSLADVKAAITDRWEIEANDRRPRNLSVGAGAGHTHDLVLRVRRRR
jgi:SAM-dependent methyltransferase